MTSIHARFQLQRGDFTLDVDLTLPDRGVSALFGPSGSGKTSCLRAMAGLEPAARGRFAIGDEVWQDDAHGVFRPTWRRPLGYVFQEASLFAHLSVRQNLEYGRKRSAAARTSGTALQDICALLGIEHLLQRAPDSLSGGERQRVAIARALLTEPRLLLMDEPLSALDVRRKQEILPWLQRLHDQLAIPVIYVSHAPDEVARLADHLVVLEAGRVRASGPLSDTLARLDLAATFGDEAGVVVQTTLAEHGSDDLSRLEFAGGSLWVSQQPVAVGSRLRCRIHARDVSLATERPHGSSIVNILPAIIRHIADADHPGQVLLRLDIGATPVLARITRRSLHELHLQEGSPVWAQIKSVALLP